MIKSDLEPTTFLLPWPGTRPTLLSVPNSAKARQVYRVVHVPTGSICPRYYSPFYVSIRSKPTPRLSEHAILPLINNVCPMERIETFFSPQPQPLPGNLLFFIQETGSSNRCERCTVFLAFPGTGRIILHGRYFYPRKEIEFVAEATAWLAG